MLNHFLQIWLFSHTKSKCNPQSGVSYCKNISFDSPEEHWKVDLILALPASSSQEVKVWHFDCFYQNNRNNLKVLYVFVCKDLINYSAFSLGCLGMLKRCKI